MAALVAVLNVTWFESGFPPETQTRLAALARRTERPAGTSLLVEGEVAEESGILLEGRLTLRTLVPKRGTVTILTLEPGDIWGWPAIVSPFRSTSTIVAIEPVILLVFEGAALRIALARAASYRASCIRGRSRRSLAALPRPDSTSSTSSHATRRLRRRYAVGEAVGRLSSELDTHNEALRADGRMVNGPTVSDKAIVHDEIRSSAELLALPGGRPIQLVSVRVGGFSRVPRRTELETLCAPLAVTLEPIAREMLAETGRAGAIERASRRSRRWSSTGPTKK